MSRRILAILVVFAAGAVVGHVGIPSSAYHVGETGVVMAETHKPIFATRLYTGADNLTHAEEVELKFNSGSPVAVSNLMRVTAVELHRSTGGAVGDWHRAPRRQYVITLSGRGELEVAGGEKIPVGPGHIEIVEDTTGKGHITRALGTEDRVTLQLPIAEQSDK